MICTDSITDSFANMEVTAATFVQDSVLEKQHLMPVELHVLAKASKTLPSSFIPRLLKLDRTFLQEIWFELPYLWEVHSQNHGL